MACLFARPEPRFDRTHRDLCGLSMCFVAHNANFWLPGIPNLPFCLVCCRPRTWPSPDQPSPLCTSFGCPPTWTPFCCTPLPSSPSPLRLSPPLPPPSPQPSRLAHCDPSPLHRHGHGPETVGTQRAAACRPASHPHQRHPHACHIVCCGISVAPSTCVWQMKIMG